MSDNTNGVKYNINALQFAFGASMVGTIQRLFHLQRHHHRLKKQL